MDKQFKFWTVLKARWSITDLYWAIPYLVGTTLLSVWLGGTLTLTVISTGAATILTGWSAVGVWTAISAIKVILLYLVIFIGSCIMVAPAVHWANQGDRTFINHINTLLADNEVRKRKKELARRK